MTAYADPHWHTITCAACHQTVNLQADDHVRFGEFWYHQDCMPTCRTCGRTVEPEGEAAWSYRAQVVSTSFGYSQDPSHFVCPTCLDNSCSGSLHDAMPYLD